jgi:rhodanese-related sulfurtransferase
MDELLRFNREGAPLPRTVSGADAAARVAAGGASSVIDVRTGLEFDNESIAGSRHLPLSDIREHADEVRRAPAPRLLLCATGVRAAQAVRVLSDLGVGGLAVVEGGLDAYRRAGGASVRGVQRMSLERQTRIAAGSLLIVFVVLGFLVHPAWFALCAVIGAGLVFAGLTNWCGMGLALARMPWNRTRRGTDAGAPPGCAASCAATPSPGNRPTE